MDCERKDSLDAANDASSRYKYSFVDLREDFRAVFRHVDRGLEEIERVLGILSTMCELETRGNLHLLSKLDKELVVTGSSKQAKPIPVEDAQQPEAALEEKGAQPANVSELAGDWPLPQGAVDVPSSPILMRRAWGEMVGCVEDVSDTMEDDQSDQEILSDVDDERAFLNTPLHNNSTAVRVGGCLARFSPSFSADGKIVFICVKNDIKLLSVVTAQQVGVLKGHKGTVVGIAENLANKMQIFSASHDGTIRSWDFYAEKCLQVFTIGAPIMHMALAGPSKLVLNVDRSYYSKKAGNSCRILMVDLPTDLTRVEVTKKQVLYKSKACAGLTVSPNLQYVASIAKRSLHIWSKRDKKLLRHTHTRTITCLCFHPTEPYIATGDAGGEITLWWRFDNPAELVTSTLHWHAHALSSLCFSQDGAYLLSGGEEGVLVMWQLETGNRHFLPRIGSGLSHISTSRDGDLYTLACSDNVVRFVDATSNTVVRSHVGLQYAHRLHRLQNKNGSVKDSHYKKQFRLLTGIVPWLRSGKEGVVSLAGVPGSLQFYNVVSDTHVASHVLHPRNVVSRTGNRHLSSTCVTHIVFCGRDEKCMITLEKRISSESETISWLKFWEYSSSSARYLLNTTVTNPHKQDVVALKASGGDDLGVVATLGFDRTVKLWTERKTQVQQLDSLKQTSSESFSTQWSCSSVLSYRSYQPRDCAFSSDGSLLAIAFGQVVTLWELKSTSEESSQASSDFTEVASHASTFGAESKKITPRLLHQLVHPPPAEYVRSVFLIPSSPFLVAATQRTLYVWHLLTSQVWWSCSLSIAALAIDPKSTHFAVVALVNPEQSLEKEPSSTSREVESSGSKAKPSRKIPDSVEGQKIPKKEERNAAGHPNSAVHIILFSPETPVPVRMWMVADIQIDRDSRQLADKSRTRTEQKAKSPVKPSEDLTASLAFLESGPRRGKRTASLVYLNRYKNLVRIDSIYDSYVKARNAKTTANESGIAALSASPSSSFHQVYGTITYSTTVGSSKAWRQKGRKASSYSSLGSSSSLRSLFAAPCHVSPPVSTMFNAFMETVIPVATNATTVSMKEIEEVVPKANDENDEQAGDAIDIKFDVVSISGIHLRESLQKAFSFGRADSTAQNQRKRKR